MKLGTRTLGCSPRWTKLCSNSTTPVFVNLELLNCLGHLKIKHHQCHPCVPTLLSFFPQVSGPTNAPCDHFVPLRFFSENSTLHAETTTRSLIASFLLSIFELLRPKQQLVDVLHWLAVVQLLLVHELCTSLELPH